MSDMRYIVVTGGVVSGLGKGTTISSIGALLRERGVRVTAVKIDPYINVDAGTMSPAEHGEAFVLDDGSEVDLDLGCYERFLGVRLTGAHSITTGKVFRELIRRERRGDYLGRTVQFVPHATDLVRELIEAAAALPVGGAEEAAAAATPQVCLVELGGTVGDIESQIFLEALRSMRAALGPARVQVAHVSLVPAVGGEQKTKPTQHSVAELRRCGLVPDVLVCRCDRPLAPAVAAKLRARCQVPAVVCMADAPNLYHVPDRLRRQGVDAALGAALGLWEAAAAAPELAREWWTSVARHLSRPGRPAARLAVVGKYVGQQTDAYLSLRRALTHASHALAAPVHVEWVDTGDLGGADGAQLALRGADAVIVPGGFGRRGFDEKIAVVQHARRSGLPFLGLCLGFQAAVVEFARNALGAAAATSEEFAAAAAADAAAAAAADLYVVSMPETDKSRLGGTMRLGARATNLAAGSLAREVYGGRARTDERHRHRYEVNPARVEALEASGLRFSGRDDTGRRMEVLELDRREHPFFMACQFHPEYRSSFDCPHPLFLGLLKAAIENKRPEPHTALPATRAPGVRASAAWTNREEQDAENPQFACV